MNGEIVDEWGVDVLYMCTDCTTVRYGHPESACPACGHSDVALLELDESPEGNNE